MKLVSFESNSSKVHCPRTKEIQLISTRRNLSLPEMRKYGFPEQIGRFLNSLKLIKKEMNPAKINDFKMLDYSSLDFIHK